MIARLTNCLTYSYLYFNSLYCTYYIHLLSSCYCVVVVHVSILPYKYGQDMQNILFCVKNYTQCHDGVFFRASIQVLMGRFQKQKNKIQLLHTRVLATCITSAILYYIIILPILYQHVILSILRIMTLIKCVVGSPTTTDFFRNKILKIIYLTFYEKNQNLDYMPIITIMIHASSSNLSN